MEIFKENNVSLAGGCLPMLVMVIVLWPVFYMVREYEYQFTNAHFLWVGSAYAHKFSWIGQNLAQFDLPLFVVYLATTIAYSALQPKPADPQQAQQQKMMTYMMPVMFGGFMWVYKWSSAFMLYWLILNLVSMYQSWRLNKEFGSSAVAAIGPGGPGSGGSGGNGTPATPLPPMKGTAKKKTITKRAGSSGRIQPKEAGGRG
jgi:YidC/Oxa1 family membrane protein insertase